MAKDYIGIKKVKATAYPKNDEAGYGITYPDGYESWSPKEVFEEAYREIDKLDFPSAFWAARRYDRRIARKGWNGKDQCIFLTDAIPGLAPTAVIATGKECYPWTPSQGDLFATDWFILPEEEYPQP